MDRARVGLQTPVSSGVDRSIESGPGKPIGYQVSMKQILHVKARTKEHFAGHRNVLTHDDTRVSKCISD